VRVMSGFFGNNEVKHTDEPHLYLDENGVISWHNDLEFFTKQESQEISWQEYLYGEGWFFKCNADDTIFFQAENNNEVYWLEGKNIENVDYDLYGSHNYPNWQECDMHGNPLTNKQENDMKQELNYTIPWKVKYNSEEELDAIRAVFKGLGCEMYKDLGHDTNYDYVSVGYDYDKLDLSSEGNYHPIVDLLTAVKYLLTPVKSKEQMEREEKIAELEQSVANMTRQIEELKGSLK